ncbi:tyrosinase family oxidase copper chaperone [Streptomyces sp. NPDC127072]|uniref:tyrosinase family oxidase copper chaperone n=1 Tax=Streptomyces sp. NPDC127072 TaxID=3347129 RepID=UPI003663FFF8
MFVNRVPSRVSSAVSVRATEPVVPGDAGELGRPVDPPRVSRRDVVRGLLVSAVVAALAPVVAASRPAHPPLPARPEDSPFDEVYRGRHLLGSKTGTDDRDASGGGEFHGGEFHGGEWRITVDGRPLPLMRRADGTYLSMVDHYQSYPTALTAARAAVDELGPTERLRGTDAEGGGHRHGVHA